MADRFDPEDVLREQVYKQLMDAHGHVDEQVVPLVALREDGLVEVLVEALQRVAYVAHLLTLEAEDRARLELAEGEERRLAGVAPEPRTISRRILRILDTHPTPFRGDVRLWRDRDDGKLRGSWDVRGTGPCETVEELVSALEGLVGVSP